MVKRELDESFSLSQADDTLVRLQSIRMLPESSIETHANNFHILLISPQPDPSAHDDVEEPKQNMYDQGVSCYEAENLRAKSSNL